MPLPDFIIIGAMKCATTTLHDQLAHQPGISMSTPKEPNYFSDDEVFERGRTWYESLFTRSSDLQGESSTHYTKLPMYPRAVSRMQEILPDTTRFIYIMRHPIDRLISQFIHEWTQRTVGDDIDAAIETMPELVEYSRYAMQIAPYLDAFGSDRVLSVFFDRLKATPQPEFERIGQFIGYEGELVWSEDQQRNVSSDRMRKSALKQALFHAPVLKSIRRRFVPQSWRDRAKRIWTMNERPELSVENINKLTAIFDEDLAQLEPWIRMRLTCDTFVKQVMHSAPAEKEQAA